jgi:hypothetical protein
MSWFCRDHTGRPLNGHEREFVDALAELLTTLAPSQVDEDETALTAEGTECLIALIPHRALGGVSIVVWLFAHRAAVTWAQVAGLDCCHDSLDLGIGVAEFGLDRRRPDFAPLLDSIREQLNAPLTLRCYGDDRATVLTRDHRNKPREVGSVGRNRNWPDLLAGFSPTREVVVRFTDTAPPPVTSPSGVDEWFGTDGHRRN